jgi:ABC-type multidrug transport system ATPase subunit
LQDCKNDKSRAIVLTTHSMEEADVLCSRIGIVSDGVLKCIGTQVRLKNLYGGGYHLFVNCQKSKYLRTLSNFNENIQQIHDNVTTFVALLLPTSILLRNFNGNFVY